MFNEGNRVRRLFKYEYKYYHRPKRRLGVDDLINNPRLIEELSDQIDVADANLNELQTLLDEILSDNYSLELQIREKDAKLDENSRIEGELEENLRVKKIELREKESDLEQLKTAKTALDIELARTKLKLEEAGRNSSIQFTISLISSILLAIGVNIITTVSNDWKGWLMIITGVTLGFVAFLISRKKT